MALLSRTLATLALGIAFAVQAELSPAEERIVAAARGRSEAALALLERTVSVNSGTLNTEGVREVGRIFAAELEALGFRTRWVDMPESMERAGHLLATREGKRGKRLLLLGHLDTVFEKQSPFQAWERRGARVRGPGAVDMKGGNVILLEALRALHRNDALDDTTITVLLTGDEERLGTPVAVARRELLEAAKRSDAALSFEGQSRDPAGRDGVATSRRASGSFRLTVTAAPGHSAGIFSDKAGFGAIYEGARILNAFREKVAEPGLSFSPGVIVGGTVVTYDAALGSGSAFGKGNVIPRSFIASSDLRYIDAAQGDRARARMREIVAQSLPGTNAEIRFFRGYPPMPETPGNARLQELYSKASADAGLGVVGIYDPADRGSGDIQFAAPHVDCLDGLGPIGRGAHTVDEEMEIASIERNAIRAALMIYRLTR
jgi:glutamate carboxypeptidase